MLQRKANRLLLVFLALALWVQADAQQPDITNKATAHGIELYQQGQLDEAIKVLSEVVKKHSDDADAWYYLGLAHYGQGGICWARPAFEHLIKLRPDSAEAHAKLAFALILSNQREQAMAMAKRAIELGDQSPESHYAIADASFRGGDTAKAIEEAEIALRIKPDFKDALITESLAQYSLKQYPESAASVERLLGLDLNDSEAKIWQGQLDEIRNGTYQLTNPSVLVLTSKEVTQKARILSKPEPTYSEEARKACVTGTVVLRAIFNSQGEVKHVLVLRALGYGLTTKAIQAARLIRFEPATVDGRPVSMYLQLEYNFSLY
jgi:TonB family protein